MEQPPEITNEFIADRLTRNAFLDIEGGLDEESTGWVEALDMTAADFTESSFDFGPAVVLGMRVDQRKVSPKVLKRYLALAEAQRESETGQPVSSKERREIKGKLHQELMGRTPVSTDVYEVCWFIADQEVWLMGAGTKLRERFEDLWRRTFGLGLVMLIPFVLARELAPAEADPEALDRARPAVLFGSGG
jgi:DNA recombination-dependent growth factor C